MSTHHQRREIGQGPTRKAEKKRGKWKRDMFDVLTIAISHSSSRNNSKLPLENMRSDSTKQPAGN
jgi:hypothetical protein